MTKEILTSKSGEEWEQVDTCDRHTLVNLSPGDVIFRKLKKPEMPEIRPGDRVVFDYARCPSSVTVLAVRGPYPGESENSLADQRIYYWNQDDNPVYTRGWAVIEIHRDGQLLWKRN